MHRSAVSTFTQILSSGTQKCGGGVGWGGGYFYYSIRRDETRRLRTSVETLEPARRTGLSLFPTAERLSHALSFSTIDRIFSWLNWYNVCWSSIIQVFLSRTVYCAEIFLWGIGKLCQRRLLRAASVIRWVLSLGWFVCVRLNRREISVRACVRACVRARTRLCVRVCTVCD